MVSVGIRLRMRVAGDAREHRKIREVGMAIAAARPPACVRSGVDREPGMVEHRTEPGNGRVAGGTGGGEHRSGMVRIVGSGVIRFVAAITIGGEGAVVFAFVASVASDRLVEAGQWKRGLAVIKRSWHPRGSRVTDFASRRESTCLVIRICGAVVIVQMARHAGRRHSRELPVFVTCDASQGGVKTG